MCFPDFFRGKAVWVVEEMKDQAVRTKLEALNEPNRNKELAALQKLEIDALFENKIMVIKKLYEDSLEGQQR
jgi:hypothetical protein